MGKGKSGASGGKKATSGSDFAKEEPKESVEAILFVPKKRGQIEKVQASAIYKALKNGDIQAKPEFIKTIYNETDAYYGSASQRYSQNYVFYDSVEKLTNQVMSGNYKGANETIKSIEDALIRNAGKKSIWYKYKRD